jgi:5-formyltetrahydrofolate cyclo-ligase
MIIADEKRMMRQDARARRARFGPAAPQIMHRMAEHFLKEIPLAKDAVVAGYLAINDEADPAPLLEILRARGHRIALPRVVGRGESLRFHYFEPGAALVTGGYGLSEPAADWPEAVPDVLLVPLLAFDETGHRLGYGAGYYDMSLAQLRAQQSILAVGYAYEGQKVSSVPHTDADEKLDWVVTEQGAQRF